LILNNLEVSEVYWIKLLLGKLGIKRFKRNAPYIPKPVAEPRRLRPHLRRSRQPLGRAAFIDRAERFREWREVPSIRGWRRGRVALIGVLVLPAIFVLSGFGGEYVGAWGNSDPRTVTIVISKNGKVTTVTTTLPVKGETITTGGKTFKVIRTKTDSIEVVTTINGQPVTTSIPIPTTVTNTKTDTQTNTKTDTTTRTSTVVSSTTDTVTTTVSTTLPGTTDTITVTTTDTVPTTITETTTVTSGQ